MTINEKIGRMFMIGFSGTRLSEEVRRFILDYHIGFVILFSRNIESIDQVRQLTHDIHSLGPEAPLVYIDQEGGTIVRFGELAATAISAMGIAATGDPANAELAGRLIGEDMKACGIDGVFAPVLDVNTTAENPVIGVRSFSDNPETVISYATAFMHGLESQGLLTCGKHFPGHGAASADSHLQIPEIDVSQSFFNRYCLSPFEALTKEGIDSIMTGHLRFPRMSPEISTLSPYFVPELLRKRIGFDGVVFSDCLEMNAVTEHFTPEDVVHKALSADLDVLIPSHTLSYQKELIEILTFKLNKGTIPETRIHRSHQRITALRDKSSCRGGGGGSFKKSPLPAGGIQIKTRTHYTQEQTLADQSITLIKAPTAKNQQVPLNHQTAGIIIEWQKRIVGPNIQEDETQSIVADTGRYYLPQADTAILHPEQGETLPETLQKRLKQQDDSFVIAFIYTHAGEATENQFQGLNRLLSLRPDTIVVSLDNPYLLNQFPDAKTFFVTYGFRKVQVDALFRVITGQLEAKGTLPVEVNPGLIRD